MQLENMEIEFLEFVKSSGILKIGWFLALRSSFFSLSPEVVRKKIMNFFMVEIGFYAISYPRIQIPSAENA